MIFSFESYTKFYVKWFVCGCLAVFPTRAVSFLQEQDKKNRELIQFYEYRRLLLNASKRHSRDSINDAHDYTQRIAASVHSGIPREGYFTLDSYEHLTNSHIQLKDCFLHYNSILTSAVAGAIAGLLAYARLYSKFLVPIPPQKMAIVYWRNAGIKFTPSLYKSLKAATNSCAQPTFAQNAAQLAPSLSKGLFQHSNFIAATKATVSDSVFVLPSLQQIGFIDLKPFPIQVDQVFALKNRLTSAAAESGPTNYITIKGTLSAQVQELESDEQVIFNASHLLNFTLQQCTIRAQLVVQETLKQICEQTSLEEIERDRELFYIYLQQRIGQALLNNCGARVVKCEVLGFESQEHRHIGYVGGNITNSYYRKCNQWISYLFRFIFALGRMKMDWKRFKKE